MTIRRPRKNEAGFSLVEVLVAISLLIVGIVAIIELFPPGFLTLNGIDIRSRAQAAAQDEANRAAISQVSLIYSQYDEFGDQPAFSNDVATSANYNNLNANSERIVSGEIFPIPQSVTKVGTSIYTVAFGPILLPAADPAAEHICVRGTPWTTMPGTSFGPNTSFNTSGIPPAGLSDPSDQLTPNQPQVLVDYTAGQIALPLQQSLADFNYKSRTGTAPAVSDYTSASTEMYKETLTISVVGSDGVRYTGTLSYDPSKPNLVAPPIVSGTTTNAIDQQFHSLWFDPSGYTIAANSVQNWPSTVGPPKPWVVNTLSVSRDYALTATQPTGAYEDPYQFYVKPNIVDSTGVNTDLNEGVLLFPASASALRDSTGNPVKACVDYTVADWHILCEDHVASTDTIRVDAPSINTLGDDLDAGDGGGNYKGIIDWRSTTAATAAASITTRDIYILNLDTGTDLVDAVPANAAITDPNADTVNTDTFSTNYSAGRISLPASYARSNTRLRIFYRARHQWSVNVNKAASLYAYSATAPATMDRFALAKYWVESNGYTLDFPLTDVGKTVNLGAVTYLTSSSGPIQRIDHGGSWVILAGATTGYIDLRVQSLRVGDISYASDINPQGFLATGQTLVSGSGQVPVTDVRGGSVTVRTEYFDQNTLRHQDVTSYLNPGQ